MTILPLLVALHALSPREQVALSQSEQVAAERHAAELDAAAAQADSEADRLRARSAALAAQVQADEAALSGAQARSRLIARRRRAIALRIADQRAPLARLLAAQARMGRRPILAALFEQRSIADAGHLRALFASTWAEVDRRTEAMRMDLAVADKLQRDAATTLRQRIAATRALAQTRDVLAAAERKQRQASGAFLKQAESDRAESLRLAQDADTLSALAAKLDRAAAISARLAALPTPLPRPGQAGEPIPGVVDAAAPAAAPRYRLPANGRVVSGSGEVSDTGMRARGITLALDAGAQAVAPAAGRVAYAGPFRTYAGVIIIDHGNGWTSLIAGLSRVTVSGGALVLGGSPIGRTGRDLLVELRHYGRPVDIVRMIQLTGR